MTIGQHKSAATLGKPIQQVAPEDGAADFPGMDWELSAETLELMRSIDDHARLASAKGSSVLFG